MRKTAVLTFCIALAAMCAADIARSAEQDGAAVRKKLFLIERKLARSTDKRAGGSLSEIVGGQFAIDKIKSDLMSSMDNASSATTDDAAQSSKGKNTEADGSKQQDFGSVTAKLDGGSLTSFSYSGTGIDLSSLSPDYGIVLLLQSNEIDVSGLKEDDSINDRFASSNRESFYGLDDYKDMEKVFEKKAPGKDYSMMGLGLTLNDGPYTLGIVNYSKPPQKKKKIFFGGDSVGPYQIGATGIVPGTESVRAAGVDLTRGDGYTIDYNKGEITFDTPVSLSDKIVIEYELAQSGGGAPGKFTGFRVQRENKPESSGRNTQGSEDISDEDDSAADYSGANADQSAAPELKKKKFSFEKWGVSYLRDEVVSYRSNSGAIERGFMDHSLMGFDGGVSLGRFGEAGFEYARSSGDKSAASGRFASATFTTADTHASDGAPSGPYYLDEETLPIMEGSEEVRVNGVLLERDKDYTIDTTYGYLRLKKKDLDLGPADTVAVTYRYLTEEDRLNAGSAVASDSASKFSIKNEFGKFTHTFETSNFGENYLQVGGTAANNLLDRKQSFGFTPAKGLELKMNRGISQALRDRSTGLRESAERDEYALNYKRGERLSFAWKSGEDRRYDNLAARQTDNTQTRDEWRLDLAPGKIFKIGLQSFRSGNTSTPAASAASENSDTKNTLTFSAKPSKKLSFNTTQARGRSSQNSGGLARDRDQSTSDYVVKYQVTKALKLDYALNENSFSSTDESAAAQAATGAFSTDTVQANSADTGNRTEKIALAYNPSKRMTVAVSQQTKAEDFAGGGRTTRQNNNDLRYKLSEKTSMQFRMNTIASDRGTQTQDTAVKSLSFSTKFGLLPRGVQMDLKREHQDSDISTGEAAAAVSTAIRSRSTGLSLSMEPFWEGKSIQVEWQWKRNGNETNGVSTPESEMSRNMSFEAPFIKESVLAFEYNRQKRNGARATCATEKGVTLSGKLTSLFDLQFSWRSQSDADYTTPSASSASSDITTAIKGQIEW